MSLTRPPRTTHRTSLGGALDRRRRLLASASFACAVSLAVACIEPVSVGSGHDTAPPSISAGQPSGSLPAGTTETTMRVTTNEDATCRWSTSEADAFVDMPNVFTTTGGVAHSTSLTGLVDGERYTYWVRCEDLLGNANTTSHPVSFGVGVEADMTAPVISNPLPSGTLPAGTRQVSIRVTTNEAATCRFGNVDAAYAQLPNTFSTTGGTSHVSLLVGFSDGQTYTFYARCQDPSGNANTSSTAITFSIAAS